MIMLTLKTWARSYKNNILRLFYVPITVQPIIKPIYFNLYISNIRMVLQFLFIYLHFKFSKQTLCKSYKPTFTLISIKQGCIQFLKF